MIHEDERRTLEDWPEAKTIFAKKACTLGDHFHKIKTERFILVGGSAEIIINGIRNRMKIGRMYQIYPHERHTFNLDKDSVMIGLCSHVYDPTDDYK